MPELPEVQTTVSGLQLIIKKQITSIKVNTTKLRYLIPKKIDQIAKNKEIIRIYRLGKYIIFELSNSISLIFHLGMTGRIRLLKKSDYRKLKHDHIIIYLNYNEVIIFNDPRKFGFVDISKTSEFKQKKYISNLGLDPFQKELDENYLLNKFDRSSIPIKQLLLNQKIVAGIGNIYANEILFDAKISPFLPGSQLDFHKVSKLIKSIRRILKKAISFGGTSLKDYVSVDGTLGNFQTKFKVYNRENEKISKFRVRRVIQYGRSTFFCPNLQKSKFNPPFYT